MALKQWSQLQTLRMCALLMSMAGRFERPRAGRRTPSRHRRRTAHVGGRAGPWGRHAREPGGKVGLRRGHNVVEGQTGGSGQSADEAVHADLEDAVGIGLDPDAHARAASTAPPGGQLPGGLDLQARPVRRPQRSCTGLRPAPAPNARPPLDTQCGPTRAGTSIWKPTPRPRHQNGLRAGETEPRLPAAPCPHAQHGRRGENIGRHRAPAIQHVQAEQLRVAGQRLAVTRSQVKRLAKGGIPRVPRHRKVRAASAERGERGVNADGGCLLQIRCHRLTSP